MDICKKYVNLELNGPISFFVTQDEKKLLTFILFNIILGRFKLPRKLATTYFKKTREENNIYALRK